jgi:hypothetical protein
MAILEAVKKALLIPIEEAYADTELNLYINACKELLISIGVNETLVNSESHPIVETLIIIYCKTFFGFKPDGSIKELPKSFDMLLSQLALTKGKDTNVS